MGPAQGGGVGGQAERSFQLAGGRSQASLGCSGGTQAVWGRPLAQLSSAGLASRPWGALAGREEEASGRVELGRGCRSLARLASSLA